MAVNTTNNTIRFRYYKIRLNSHKNETKMEFKTNSSQIVYLYTLYEHWDVNEMC